MWIRKEMYYILGLLFDFVKLFHLLLDFSHIRYVFLLGAFNLGLQIEVLLVGVVHILSEVLELVYEGQEMVVVISYLT